MSTSSEGRPGRYQRSVGGLIAALVVTVVVIGGVLWFLGLFRDQPETRPSAADYLPDVAAAQGAQLDPVYPASLPDGWIVASFEVYDAATDPTLETRLFTDDDAFVGIHQQAASESALIRELVEEDAEPTDVYAAERSVAEAWQGYQDDGGDAAYATRVGDDVVVVYGSVAPEELQAVIERLTTEPVADRRSPG